MSYLLRVELPDIPGSLGALATAIGATGVNIDAIEIVERNPGGYAIDDVFIAANGDVMPDSIVSACTALDDVSVHWISRYAAGGNLFLDLEAVEAISEEPARAFELLVDSLPQVFLVDWALHLRRKGGTATVIRGTTAAPTDIPPGVAWPESLLKAQRIEVPEKWSELVVAGSPLSDEELIVIGRRGGPEFLDSEIARMAHLVALTASIHKNA